MKKVIVGDGSIREALKVIASNIQGSTTVFKDVESGELSTEIPSNTMFEIINIPSNGEIKSGRENRRIRRKAQRKKK
jgi:hypothetical protein